MNKNFKSKSRENNNHEKGTIKNLSRIFAMLDSLLKYEKYL